MKGSLLMVFFILIGATSAAPKDDKKPLAFPRKAFIFSYNDGKLEVVGDGISVTGDNVQSAIVTITGDGITEFKVEDHPDNQGRISLSPSGKPLSDETLKKDVLIFSIVVKKDKETALSDIFVLLPNSRPSISSLNFPQNVYFGDYKIEDGRAAVTADIKLDRGSGDVTIELGGDYKDSFEASVSNNDVTLSVKTNLDDDVLSKSNEVTVTLTATSGDFSDSADVVLSLPSVKFGDNLYFVDYSESGELTTDRKIVVTATDLNSVGLTVTPTEVFSVDWADKSSGEVTLSLADGSLPPTEKNDILVTVTAQLGDLKATTDVIVKLPSKQKTTPLHFTSHLYTGKYTKYTRSVTMNDQVTVIAEDLRTVEISLDEDSEKMFSQELDLTGVVTLTPNSLFTADGNEFIVKVSAKSGEKIVTSDVAIQLPDTQNANGLHFNENFYLGEYTEEGGRGKIEIEGFKLEGGTAKLEFDEEGKKYFNDPKLEEGVVTVELKDVKISDDDLKDKNEIIAKVTATEDSAEDPQEVTVDIIVKLPEEAVTTPLHFSSNIYVTDYADGKLGAADNEIIVQSEDLGKVTVAVDRTDFFQATVSKATGIVTLNVVNALEGDILKQKEIVVKVTASNSVDDVTSDVIVRLAKPTSLRFTSNIYQAEYSDKLVAQGIKVEADDLNSVDVSTDDKHFKPTVDKATGEVTLELVAATLPDAVIKDKREVIVKVTATTGEESQSSDVVVVLEKKVKNPLLHFTGKVFVAEYEKNDKDEVTIQADTEVEIVGNDDKIEIEVENNVFNATVTDGKVTLTWTDAKDALKDSKDYLQVKLTATDGDQKDEATLYLVLPKSGAFGHAGVATISLMMSVVVALFLA